MSNFPLIGYNMAEAVPVETFTLRTNNKYSDLCRGRRSLKQYYLLKYWRCCLLSKQTIFWHQQTFFRVLWYVYFRSTLSWAWIPSFVRFNSNSRLQTPPTLRAPAGRVPRAAGNQGRPTMPPLAHFLLRSNIIQSHYLFYMELVSCGQSAPSTPFTGEFNSQFYYSGGNRYVCASLRSFPCEFMFDFCLTG